MRISGICGSLRRHSWNSVLLSIFIKHINIQQGGKGKIEDIKSIPSYNQDIEDKGMPQFVITIRENIKSSDLVVFAAPTYNSSYSAVTKNIIGWVSRPANCLNRKYGLVKCAKLGISGALLSYTHLNQVMFHLRIKILNQPRILVPEINKRINAAGQVIDSNLKYMLSEAVKVLIQNLKQFAI